jgi:cell division protein FtsI/penicillin-binding protein 2
MEQIQLSRNISQGEIGSAPLAIKREESSQVYPLPSLRKVSVEGAKNGRLELAERPDLASKIGDRYASLTNGNNFVFYTIDPELQAFVSNLVGKAGAKHVAVVAMNPRTGAILAIAGKSASIPDIEYHADFPAASLFKVVTAAAAVEQAGIQPDSLIPFRGGTYTLNEWNYLPDPKRDRKVMSVGEALGRSCNPVFGHLGLRYLNGNILHKYARLFGFNRSLQFEAPLTTSAADIPTKDMYELSRTAAGFGSVRISPIHAAAMMAGVSNGGLLPRPHIVSEIVSRDGEILTQAKPDVLNRVVQPSTAASLMEMMRYTTTVGTSRREFMRGTQPTLGNIQVAGKTGTLRGSNPEGLNNWFIGSAPLNNPELALAVITVDAPYSGKASRLGRKVFEKYFNVTPLPDAPSYTRVSTSKKRSSAKAKSSSKSKKVVGKVATKKKNSSATTAAKSSKKQTKRK